MMRFLMMSLAVAVTACALPEARPVAAAATPPPIAAVVVQADRVILSGERAFAVAELAYITAADGVARLAQRGLIPAAAAGRVRGWNAVARDLLVKGKATADAAERARAAAALFGFAAQLDTLREGR